jgi:hypothetical protein
MMMNKLILAKRGIVNKGFSGFLGVITRSKFYCNLIGKRPLSLTNYTANRQTVQKLKDIRI